MKFVERGIACNDSDGNQCPAEMRFLSSRSDSAQHQQTQSEVFDEMRALADQVMKF